MAAALEAAGAAFPRRALSRQRHVVIAASQELQERELIKLAMLSTALADALRRRGVGDPAAGLAADVGIAVFTSAFQRWVDAPDERDFAELVRASLADLRAVTAGTARGARPSRLLRRQVAAAPRP